MSNLTKTAGNLDTFFKVLGILIKICAIALLVGLGLIAAVFVFGLDPHTVGTGYTSLDIGGLTLELAPAYAPEERLVLSLLAAEMALGLVCLIVLSPCVTCVRDILRPMTEGKPFHTSVSENLKKLTRRSILLWVLVNCIEGITAAIYFFGFDLAGLLVGEKITHITYTANFDLTFLIIAAVLYLLRCIFQYGEQLQQLSDETI